MERIVAFKTVNGKLYASAEEAIAQEEKEKKDNFAEAIAISADQVGLTSRFDSYTSNEFYYAAKIIYEYGTTIFLPEMLKAGLIKGYTIEEI